MFIGGDHTGWGSAVIYTFVEQVRRHGADPFGYFEWVFEKLMHHPPEVQLEDLLPANWLATRRAPCQNIESREAWMPEPPDLWQKCQRCSVERLHAAWKRDGLGQ